MRTSLSKLFKQVNVRSSITLNLPSFLYLNYYKKELLEHVKVLVVSIIFLNLKEKKCTILQKNIEHILTKK